jgi:GntR family transcriptional regulator/MocR family aminotransferase
VAPPALRAAIRFERANDDKGTPVLDQLAFAILLERGETDRHVRRSRLVYRRRRDRLVAALARQLPEARSAGVAAGRHVVLRLPDGVDDQAVMAAAARRGVATVSPPEHRTLPAGPALILGYGQVTEAAIPAAVGELAHAVREAI